MLIRVYAQTPAEFAAWVAQQQTARAAGLRRRSRWRRKAQAVFMHNACISCHTIAGTVATGRFGPDLTHLASRDTIASGSIPNTPAQSQKVDRRSRLDEARCLMPAMHLNDRDLDAVTAYLHAASLTSHRKGTPDEHNPRAGRNRRDAVRRPRAGRRWNVVYEWLTTVDHKKIGIMYIVYALIFLLVGGRRGAADAHPAGGPQQSLRFARRSSTSSSPCTAPPWCFSWACRFCSALGIIWCR